MGLPGFEGTVASATVAAGGPLAAASNPAAAEARYLAQVLVVGAGGGLANVAMAASQAQLGSALAAAESLVPRHLPAVICFISSQMMMQLCHEALADFRQQHAWAADVTPAVETGECSWAAVVGGRGTLHGLLVQMSW